MSIYRNKSMYTRNLCLGILVFFISVFETFGQTPIISSFSPSEGPIGTVVTVTGQNFGTTPLENLVYFGTIQATVASASDTELMVIVPAGAAYDFISVRLSGQIASAYSITPFMVTFESNEVLGLSSFGALQSFGTGNDAADIVIADFDADGKNEFAVSCHGGAEISVYQNIGTGPGAIAMANRTDFITGPVPYSLVAADVTSDAKPEVIVANFERDDVSVLSNISSNLPSFNNAGGVSYASGESPRDIAMADFDGDGLLDIAVINELSSTVSVLLNTYDFEGISYGSKTDFAVGGDPRSIIAVDFDQDGRSDIIVANRGANTVSFLMNNTASTGAVSFQDKTDYASSTFTYSAIDVADINNDGQLDLITVNENANSISVYETSFLFGSGLPAFLVSKEFTVGSSPQGVALADLNGDGLLDIVTANLLDNTISILKNETNTNTGIDFASKTDVATVSQPTNVAIGDLDGDGRPDIAVACENTSSTSGFVSVFRNEILFTGTTITDFSIAEIPGELTIDETNAEIIYEVPVNSDLSSLTAKFSLSAGAVVEVDGVIQESESTINDFTSPLTYLVLAEDGSTFREWSVTVRYENILARYFFEGNAKDDSGNGKDGFIQGAVDNADRFGSEMNALNFNGFDSFIEIANSSSLALNGSYSASMWINIQNAAPTVPMTIMSKGLAPDASTSTSLLLFVNTDYTLRLFWEDEFDQENLLTTSALSPFTDYHVVVVVNAETSVSEIYINGELATSTSFSLPPFSNSDPLYIGAGLTTNSVLNRYFSGVIDDMVIYDRPITTDEIQGLFNEGGWNPNLVADITFSGDFFDHSIYRNTGTTGAGTVSFATDRFVQADQSAVFDGASFLSYPHISAYEVGNDTDISISGWFQAEPSASGRVIIDKSDGNIGYFVMLQSDGSLLFFMTQDGSTVSLASGSVGLDDGEWHYFVAQADRDGLVQVYIDGLLNSELENVTDVLNLDTTEDLLIGAAAGVANNSPNSFFLGSLDDIAFNTSLFTNEEILDVYNNGVYAVSISGSALAEEIALQHPGSLGDQSSSWSVVTELSDGELSFFLNEDNTVLYGDSGLDEQFIAGGAAINVTAGIYYINCIPAINHYRVINISNVGLIGSALTGDETGWTLDDVDMNDLGSGVYQLSYVSLFDGQYKFRPNDQWQGNWGDDGADGILDIDGENINVTAGTYDIEVDIINNTYNLSESVTPIITYSISPDISLAAYTGIAVSVAGQDSDPTDVKFNTDGTKMYVIGLASDAVTEYILAEPFDLTNVSLGSSFSYSSQETSAYGLAFSKDGSKMFIVGSSSLADNAVYEYDLSTPFDVTTAAYNAHSFIIESDDAEPSGITFNNDGTKMYISGGSTNALLEYDLAEAFNVTSAALVDATDVSSQDETIMSFVFNADGSKLYLLGRDNGALLEYELNTKFDLSTATFTQSIAIEEELFADGISFSADGTTMFIVGEINATVYSYDLGQNAFVENTLNDGTVSGALIATLSGDTFTNPGGSYTEGTEISLGNIPEGLTAAVRVGIDGLTISITLTGMAGENEDASDVLDITVDFSDDAFDNALSENVVNGTGPHSTNFGIDFNDSRGLVGYYIFNDGNFTDQSQGDGFTATAPNGQAFSKDQYGITNGAFDTGNKEFYLDIEHSGTWGFEGEVAYTAWVRPSSFDDTNDFLVTIIDGLGQFGIRENSVDFTRSELVFHWEETEGVFSTIQTEGTIHLNRWTHVAMTINEGSDLRMYIDGIKQNIRRDTESDFFESISISRFNPTKNNLTINTSSSEDRRFTGSIDNVRIYDGTYPSEEEIYEIFASKVAGGVDRLIAKYDFNAGELTDGSGNFFDGLFLNIDGSESTPILTTGFDGDASGALDFQDNGDHLSVFHDRSINLRRDFTVNFWVKVDALHGGEIGDVLFSDGELGRLMVNQEGKVFYHYPPNFLIKEETGSSIVTGVWQMLSYSIDQNDQLTVYYNGELIIDTDVLDHDFSLSDNLTASLNDVVGGESENRFFDGAMDEISIYQRVLNAEEIATIYNTSDSRLIAYYPFDGDALDYSSQGFDGIVEGAVLTEDRFGLVDGAYAFDGSDDYIMSNISSHPTGESSITYMAWVNPDIDLQTASIVTVGDALENARSSMILAGNTLVYVGENNDLASNTITVPLNTWSHVAVSKSGTSVTFYLNGEEMDNGVLGTGQNIQSTTAYIGSTFGTREFFSGAIDEVRVYNTSLSSLEIGDIYALEAPFQNQIAYYPFTDNANDFGKDGFDGTDLGNPLYTGFLTLGDNAVDAVSLPNQVMDGLTDFSVTVAVKFDALHTGSSNFSNTIISGANSNDANNFVLGVENGSQWLIGLGNVFERVSDPNIQEDVWYHMSFVRSGGELSVYKDGLLLQSITANNNTLEINAGGLIIGQEQDALGASFQQTQSLAGSLLNMRIFNEALELSDVTSLSSQDSPSQTVPEAPSDVFAEVIGANTVQVLWIDNSDDENRFYVEYTDGGGSTLTSAEIEANTTSTIITGLTTDVTYTFTVLAENTNGATSSLNTASVTPVLLGEPISINPDFPSLDEEITITVDVNNLYPPLALSGASKVYLHSGLLEPGNENMKNWVANNEFTADNGIGLMTDNGSGIWTITITDPRSYYGVDTDFVASQIGLVFRNADGTAVGKGGYDVNTATGDLFINLYDNAFVSEPNSAFASFDGSNNLFLDGADYSTPEAIVGNTSITLEAWVNIASFPGIDEFDNIVQRNTSLSTPLSLFLNTDSESVTVLYFQVTDGLTGGQTAIVGVEVDEGILNTWVHVAATYDGSLAKIYLDGYFVMEDNQPFALATNLDASEKIEIGVNFNGLVDDVQLWGIAKTQDEIRDEIDIELAGNESGLSAYWNFEDQYEESGVIYTSDQTSFGNDLRFNGTGIIPLPDLDVVIGSYPEEVVTGQDYTLSGTIYNNDQSEVAVNQTVELRIYLSTDDNLENSELLATQNEVINLAPNSDLPFSANVNIPVSFSTETSRFYAFIDASNLVFESNEDNNVSTSANTVEIYSPLLTPTGLSLSNPTAGSFDYSWSEPSDGASQWEYDVASDEGFNAILSGMQGVLVSTRTGTVSNLDDNTEYFFRVRSVDGTIANRQSEYTSSSITTEVLVVDTQAPTISVSAASKAEPSLQLINVEMSDDFGVSSVNLYVRDASQGAGTETVRSLSFPSNSFTATIEQADWGDLGVTFFLTAIDAAGNVGFSDTLTIVADLPATEQQTIPINSTGTDVTNYRIFAFPYESKSTSAVVTGAVDNTEWKLQQWNGSANVSQSTLDAGEGYWFIKSSSAISLTFNNASPISVDGEDFYISLRSGWNQIGNPYLSSIDWNQVLSANNLINGEIGTGIITYSSGYQPETSSLSKYEGGFIESNVSRNIRIPISATNRTSVTNLSWIEQNGGWEISVEFEAPNGLKYGLPGFGQFERAMDGKDDFDYSTPALFDQYIRAEFVENNLLIGQYVAKSLHSSKQNDEWLMVVNSHLASGTPLSLRINETPDFDGGEVLAMIDMTTGYSTFVEDVVEYEFIYSPEYALKFIKGSKAFVEQQMVLNQLVASHVYPNPSDGKISFSVNMPSLSENVAISLEIVDLSGKSLYLVRTTVSSGYNELNLDVSNKSFNEGLYLLKIDLSEKSSLINDSNITKKVYLKANNN